MSVECGCTMPHYTKGPIEPSMARTLTFNSHTAWEELPDLDCALMRLVSLELSLWTDVP
jgi:hypothetical protein